MTHLTSSPITMEQVALGDTWDGMYGPETRCRACGNRADIVNHYWDDPKNGTVAAHSRSEGGRTCDGTGATTSLEAAVRRDSLLNEAEEAAQSVALNLLLSCKGVWRGTDEFCGHPRCGRLLESGLRWTLMGWREA
ncbi:hypothetical protein [Streptomyces cinereoruber]|uniref:hypothetical protein n=1 Tax=Streptomyces cinereoruber TaxID=67260 RepID=UPI003665F1C4